MVDVLKGNDVVLYMKLWDSIGETATYPLALNSHSNSINADSDSESTHFGKVQVASSLEQEGSLEAYITHDDIAVNNLKKAIRNAKKVAIWEITLREDKNETAKAKEEGFIKDEDTVAYPSVLRQVNVTSLEFEYEADSLSSMSCDYSIIVDAEGFEYLSKNIAEELKNTIEYKHINEDLIDSETPAP